MVWPRSSRLTGSRRSNSQPSVINDNGRIASNKLLLNFGCTQPLADAAPRNERLKTVVGKTRCDASADPVWVSILPASSDLLIPSVIHTVDVTRYPEVPNSPTQRTFGATGFTAR